MNEEKYRLQVSFENLNVIMTVIYFHYHSASCMTS